MVQVTQMYYIDMGLLLCSRRDCPSSKGKESLMNGAVIQYK